jgi:hypothetical protein
VWLPVGRRVRIADAAYRSSSFVSPGQTGQIVQSGVASVVAPPITHSTAPGWCSGPIIVEIPAPVPHLQRLDGHARWYELLQLVLGRSTVHQLACCWASGTIALQLSTHPPIDHDIQRHWEPLPGSVHTRHRRHFPYRPHRQPSFSLLHPCCDLSSTLPDPLRAKSPVAPAVRLEPARPLINHPGRLNLSRRVRS